MQNAPIEPEEGDYFGYSCYFKKGAFTDEYHGSHHWRAAMKRCRYVHVALIAGSLESGSSAILLYVSSADVELPSA